MRGEIDILLKFAIKKPLAKILIAYSAKEAERRIFWNTL